MYRCGWCGCFCDNERNVLTPTDELIKNAHMMESTSCNVCNLNESIKSNGTEVSDNEKLKEIRHKYNKKISTGDY